MRAKTLSKKFLLLMLVIFPSVLLFADNNLLKETSHAFTKIGKKAIPAVVFIKSEIGGQSSAQKSPEEYDNPFDYFHDEFFKHFFGGPQGPKQPQPQVGAGSGFIVSKDGYILTNNHVVKDADKITVILNNGDEFDAKIIGTDPKTDLAVLKIESKKDLPYISFGNSDKLEIGEWAIAIGNPFELQSSLTVGVISAKGRENLRINDLEDFIQTDAAINPGNSGGPLLDIDGNVIGINTAIVTKSGGYMGIGFAIPSNMAKHVMDQLINQGSVTRGYLGVALQNIDKEMSEALGLDKTEGILVADVSKDSPAEKGGLEQGDVIVEYNGKTMKSMSTFRNEIALMKPGTDVKLKVIRKNKTKKITVKLGTSPTEQKIAKNSTELGIEVTPIKDVNPDLLSKYGYAANLEGLFIHGVKPNSMAHLAGLQPGMVILQVNQAKVKTVDDFKSAMQAAKGKKHLLLLIRSRNTTKFITIKIK